MARYLWSTPEYRAQFEAYKAGENLDGIFDENLIEVDMGSRHIRELTTAARALLRRYRSSIHTFSTGAIEAAGVNPESSASVSHNPAEDTFSFVRLAKVEGPSLKELQQQHDLEGLRRQFAEEDGQPISSFEDPRPLTDQINWAEWSNHDYLRFTDVFFRDSFVASESKTEGVWSEKDRSINWGTTEPMVDLYMALGYMIEFDKSPSKPTE